MSNYHAIVKMRDILDNLKTEMNDAHEEMQHWTKQEQLIHRTQQLAVTRYNGLQSAYDSLLSSVLHLEKHEAKGDSDGTS